MKQLSNHLRVFTSVAVTTLSLSWRFVYICLLISGNDSYKSSSFTYVLIIRSAKPGYYRLFMSGMKIIKTLFVVIMMCMNMMIVMQNLNLGAFVVVQGYMLSSCWHLFSIFKGQKIIGKTCIMAWETLQQMNIPGMFRGKV